MSYNEKPILKIYKYENSAFTLTALVDDYQECSFERNYYSAGQFTICINYNIPNASLFSRGQFIQFGSDAYDVGVVTSIEDTISGEGKGSQLRTITGYDLRYLLKRRIVQSMNSEETWAMTANGEICLRNLVYDQCGLGAESKRQLPIANTIPADADALGDTYSVSEAYSNLYDVCCTIATQSNFGWLIKFETSGLTLECYEGTDKSSTVFLDTSYESLAEGTFTDSDESFCNAIYVGGQGNGSNRDIYEGEDGTPTGLDRYEAWDNQSSMTSVTEYQAEADSMLNQYAQTLELSGNGLAKCPYVYKEQYDVGDTVKVAFSGKSANVQIQSITEHWAFGTYDLNFSFGKPQKDLSQQITAMLSEVQKYSATTDSQSTDSVMWYDTPTDTAMAKSEVTYNTIGFTGSGGTFTMYWTSDGTGAKSYKVRVKNTTGAITLTTGVAGASDLTLPTGLYVYAITVDSDGNVTAQTTSYAVSSESATSIHANNGYVEGIQFTKSDNSGYPTFRILADITDWWNATNTGNYKYSFEGDIQATRLGGYSSNFSGKIMAYCQYRRNNNTVTGGKVDNLYGLVYQALINSSTCYPIIVKDSNDNYYLALRMTGANKVYTFNGYMVNTSIGTEYMYTDNSTFPDGWTLVVSGAINSNASDMYAMKSYQNIYSQQGAYCNTAASTAAKVALLLNYELKTGSRFTMKMLYPNTSATALTLNVNSTGAKSLYINGVPSSASNYSIPAGVFPVTYDGTNYNIDTDGGLTVSGFIRGTNINALTGRTVSEAGWYKILEFGSRNIGQVLKLNLISTFNYNTNGGREITLCSSFKNFKLLEFTNDPNGIFSKIKICYNDNNINLLAVYVYYTKPTVNSLYFNISGLTRNTAQSTKGLYPFVYNFEAQGSETYDVTEEFDLHTDGLWYNGTQIA